MLIVSTTQRRRRREEVAIGRLHTISARMLSERRDGDIRLRVTMRVQDSKGGLMDKGTLINVRVTERTKESLKQHLDGVSFKDLIHFVESLFAEGDIVSENGQLYLNQQEEKPFVPSEALQEFYEACDSVSLDREVGLKKATFAVKRRTI